MDPEVCVTISTSLLDQLGFVTQGVLARLKQLSCRQKSRKTLCWSRLPPTHPPWSKCPHHCPTTLDFLALPLKRGHSAKWASVSTNTNTLDANTDVQTNLFVQLSQKDPILWIIVQQETLLYAYNNNNNKNPCTVIPRRALPPFGALLLLHFTWKPKMSKFSSFKPLFSKLAESKAESSCNLQSHSNTNVRPGAWSKALATSQRYWCSLSWSTIQGKNFALSVS